MKSNKKALIALAIAATMGLSSAANAGVLASSTFSITNFLLSDATTGATLKVSDFGGTLVATNNAGVAASLSGFPTANGAFNLPITDPNTDLPKVCVGPGCGTSPAENNFVVLTPPPVGNNFANADQLLIGSSLDLGAGTTGANAFVRSDVSLTGTATGSASSNVGVNASFAFNLATAKNIGVKFNALSSLLAFSDIGTIFPGNAQASTSLSIVLSDVNGNTVFDFNNAPGRQRNGTLCTLNQTRNRNAPINGTSNFTCDAVFSANTGLLGPGIYQLSIRQNSNTNALLVPEPGVLSMLGLGLLGMGAALRKRKAA